MKLYLFFIMTLLLQSQLSFGLGPDFSVQSPRIIVIGAGIAGLTAAYRLHQKGYAVDVYEARSRVVGRILSAYVNGVIAELGGENLADGGEAINVSALAKELGVPLEYTSRLFGHAFHHNGISSSMEDAIREYHFDPALLKEQLSALEKTSASMQEVLDQLFTSNEALKKYLSTRLAAYEGAPADQLSSAYIETLYQMLQGGLCAAHQSKEILRIHICRGNSKLTQALADKLQDRVHLNMPVVAVAKNEQDQYEIRFKDGSKAKADILLFAIP